ncbi:tRNA uridine-5-carboxymethylaminomethyl(34) synthesis GTPase MnmE [Alphaproteobacteria bacterium KMM 3653]|uniref:tRNA modification GTPase MnmE n=1 Tax=Harenicola maris TaxID=2841044 RepID=A0AAP2CNI0_9RHOB|nr:tRNA uridine-5-carboxymethylaminomethyl(34) synthesis GTPase MnmE [Harenicola maris]
MSADTIFALATPQGRSGVAVIRLSGAKVPRALFDICGKLPVERVASLLPIYSLDGEKLDTALVLYFADGKSFTGEASAELHLHGSPAIISAVLNDLGAREGLRAAEAGEFTRRALENGKMDLAQVEGLSALLEAETEVQRIQAQRVLSGALREMADGWRSGLLSVMGQIEALIDFSEEEIDTIDLSQLIETNKVIENELRQEAKGVGVAERVRSGFEVVLLGPPNAGKSTLLNALAKRDVALTSDIAGTTRDLIEVHLDLHGLPVSVVDTAGLREAENEIESMGIERARKRAASADIRIWFDAKAIESFETGEDILISAKSDLAGMNSEGIKVSAVTGDGIPALLDEVQAKLMGRVASVQTATHSRHADALLRGAKALDSARSELEVGRERIELAAEEMRNALSALDNLIGSVGVEDVLGEIFSNFCIGK